MKKGISLIVLVITIIVMVVLAASVVITLSNTEIIEKANNAVEATNIKEIEQLASITWAEEFMEGKRGETLKTAVLERLKDYIDTYSITITDTGVVVKSLNGASLWVQKGLTVTDGKTTYDIGDYVDYDPTKDGSIQGITYNEGWQVLGAKDGELLLVSASSPDQSYEFWDLENYDDKGPWDFANALNEECSIYGKGEGALGARSITLEDIDRITGYDPVKMEYGKGEMHEYNNVVTYTRTSNGHIANGSNGATYTVTNGDTFILEDRTPFVVGDPPVTITSNYYDYDNKTSNGTKAWEMLFGCDERVGYANSQYCLATVLTKGNTWGYHIICLGVCAGRLSSASVEWSTTNTFHLTSNGGRGIRPVVRIAPGTVLTVLEYEGSKMESIQWES